MKYNQTSWMLQSKLNRSVQTGGIFVSINILAEDEEEEANTLAYSLQQWN